MILLLSIGYILIGIISGIVIFKRVKELKTVKDLLIIMTGCAFLWIIIFLHFLFDFICEKYGKRFINFLNSEIKK
jgi:hypothetical protein